MRESDLSYAILRPTVLFGKEDILINNIAWTLRHLPVFGLFGDGNYHLQPVYVDDVAALAVEAGRSHENLTIDAVGPETFTYRNLVNCIGDAIGIRRAVISMPPALAYAAGALMGRFLGDVLITWPEIKGLMANLLFSQSKPTCVTRLSDWMQENKDKLGLHYASELARRSNRLKSYEEL